MTVTAVPTDRRPDQKFVAKAGRISPWSFIHILVPLPESLSPGLLWGRFVSIFLLYLYLHSYVLRFGGYIIPVTSLVGRYRQR